MSENSNEELIEAYALLSLDRLSPKSQKEYLHNLKQFSTFLNSRNKLLKGSTAIDLAAFLKDSKKTCSDRTLNRKFFAIKKFYKFLRKKRLIDPDELEFLDDMRPKITEGDEAHRALSIDEIKQCRQKLNHPIYRFLFFLGVEFGLRLEEYTRIKLTDVDLKRNRLKIHGKGKKIRFIPITNRIKSTFDSFLKQRTLDGIKHDFLLYTKTGKSTERTLERYFQDMRKISGISFTSHDLRVTFATLFYNSGCDILVISKMLGHKKLETTLTYVKPTKKELEDRFLTIAEDIHFLK